MSLIHVIISIALIVIFVQNEQSPKLKILYFICYCLNEPFYVNLSLFPETYIQLGNWLWLTERTQGASNVANISMMRHHHNIMVLIKVQAYV